MLTPEDDDKTAIRSDETLQPPYPYVAQSTAGAGQEQQELPQGTRLAEFEIIGLIGIGGFGIVYLAHDDSLGRNVAIKEYMPSALASRTNGLLVRPKSERCAETFSAGMRSFINEARMLALFDHPALVKVYRFWEANGTAYMVMPHYEGKTLKQVLLEMVAPPSEAWLKKLLVPLLDALQIIHGKSCFHRDIAPDNILILEDGQPVLLDFGAARQVIGDMGKNLTVILKPGYAPVEQYAGDTSMPQGAWTDIYALGAVMHYAITGKPPMTSVMRLLNDRSEPLEKIGAGRYSGSFLRGVAQALAVKSEQRPQNIAALRSLLDVGVEPLQPGVAKQSGRETRWSGSPAQLATAGFATILAIGAGAFFVLNHDAPPVAVAAPSLIQLPVVPAASEIRNAEKPPGSLPASAATAAISAPFDPLLPLNQLFEKREPDHVVRVNLDKTRLRIGKDKLSFSVQSARAGYLYILELESSKEHLNLLFPNARDRQNKVSAGQEISLPRKSWEMTVDGPVGTDQFVVLISQHPRDFTLAGLKKRDIFAEFPIDNATRHSQTGVSDANVLSGKPVCESGSDCFAGYGAAKFSVEVVN